MKILRGYVFRLYPNKEQETLINKTIDHQDLYITTC